MADLSIGAGTVGRVAPTSIRRGSLALARRVQGPLAKELAGYIDDSSIAYHFVHLSPVTRSRHVGESDWRQAVR
jgi:hypothetical protein